MSNVNTPTEAVSLLIQGVQLAQQRGAYQLEEASLLSDAVSFLNGSTEAPEGLVDAATEATEPVDAEDTETTSDD
jgi:hypothetical protein|tara:strand:- start:2269 stop:2493 length:225 start_codon:yes stop_codon:yes gene_type:complete